MVGVNLFDVWFSFNISYTSNTRVFSFFSVGCLNFIIVFGSIELNRPLLRRTLGILSHENYLDQSNLLRGFFLFSETSPRKSPVKNHHSRSMYPVSYFFLATILKQIKRVKSVNHSCWLRCNNIHLPWELVITYPYLWGNPNFHFFMVRGVDFVAITSHKSPGLACFGVTTVTILGCTRNLGSMVSKWL